MARNPHALHFPDACHDGGEKPGEPAAADPALEARREGWRANFQDAELIRRARAARNGEKFRSLWDGRWRELCTYPSESEADLALCALIAFWTGDDPVRIEGLFRGSGHFHQKDADHAKKWTVRPDYRWRTVRGAVEFTRLHGGFHRGAPGGPELELEAARAEETVLDGPAGLRAIITAGHLAPSGKLSAEFFLLLGEDRLPYTVTAAASAVHRTASEVRALVPSADAAELCAFLRRVLERARGMVKDDAPNLQAARAIVRAEFAGLRLAFRDDHEAWSEELGAFFLRSYADDLMGGFDFLDRLRSRAGFIASQDSSLVHVAKSLGRAAWAEAIKALPEQPEAAAELGPRSRAAERARAALVAAWTWPFSWRAGKDGGPPIRASIATRAWTAARHSQEVLAREAESAPVGPNGLGPWWAIIPDLDAWARVSTGAKLGLELGMTWRLFGQVARAAAGRTAEAALHVPGLRDARTFSAIFDGYGLLEPEADRAGKDRTKVRRLSADFCEEVLQRFFGASEESE